MEKIKVEKLYFSLIWQRPTAYQNPLSYAGSKLIALIALCVLTACKQTPEPSYPWLVNTEEAYCLGKDTVDYEVWLDTLKHRVYADCMDGAHPHRPLAREFSMKYHYYRLDDLREQKPNYNEDNSFFGMREYVNGGVGVFAGEREFKGFDCLDLVLRPSKDTVFYLYKIPYIHLMNYLPTAEKKKYEDYKPAYSKRQGGEYTRRTDNKDVIYSIKHTYYVRVLNRILQDNSAFHGRANQAKVGWLILFSLNSKGVDAEKLSEFKERMKGSSSYQLVPWIDLGSKPEFPIDSQKLADKQLYDFLRKERMDSMVFIQDFLDKQKLDFLYYSRNSRYSFGEMMTIKTFSPSYHGFFLGIELDYQLVEGREIPFIKDCLLFCPRVLPSGWW